MAEPEEGSVSPPVLVAAVVARCLLGSYVGRFAGDDLDPHLAIFSANHHLKAGDMDM
jgi:hypothetical protein